MPLPFQTTLLNPLDYPHTYLQDACQYLRLKWDPNNSTPGTVVMVLMFHAIMKDGDPPPSGIRAGAFNRSMDALHEQGFVAITMEQFIAFMNYNARIPERSVLLISDDRHFAQYFENHFYPLSEKWGWPVVNAWISSPDQTYNTETGLGVWEENENLAAQGWIDYQAHGVVHYPILESSTDDYIAGELFGSINFIQERFGKTPQAFIWPGGNFTSRSIEMARQAGYQVGFTVNPRGPVMFNWVPLSDTPDPARPSYLHEGHLGDPLMVIPRYWPSQIMNEVDNVRVIGMQAAEYAQANKTTELDFYDIVCAPSLGPIPELNN
jgi:peptidoglycan/xylan/chitin deacetylase (PgdA/CDA1 family)